ncbi:signal peptidase I [Thalassotalea piscium]|uniref:Signal peptidase I n=1 Tax=Thalassotalea piscium TaxID=1230533 RepID=A0A7X0NI92_9GAMM|nr:signal peptidase I [Thalassotalea piscium]MBB6543987.1 signal peptidase I [Thalassotalea piscium]
MVKDKKNIGKYLHANKSLLLFIVLMSVFRSAVADWYTIPTSSMMPTIEVGDRITVNKMAYDIRIPFTNTAIVQLNDPQRGEIIVFNSKAADKRLIKRVIALPGDSVSMSNDMLTINGQKASYSSINETSIDFIEQESIYGNKRNIRFDKHAQSPLASFSTVIVPKDHYLVLGDNRRNSADSRVYGFVPRNELLGRAGYVAFSLNYNNYYIPKIERFIKNLNL